MTRKQTAQYSLIRIIPGLPVNYVKVSAMVIEIISTNSKKINYSDFLPLNLYLFLSTTEWNIDGEKCGETILYLTYQKFSLFFSLTKNLRWWTIDWRMFDWIFWMWYLKKIKTIKSLVSSILYTRNSQKFMSNSCSNTQWFARIEKANL